MELQVDNPGNLREHGRPYRYGQFVVRVFGDQVRAHITSGGKYYTPPAFAGQLTRRSGGRVWLQGSITESAGARLRQPLWRALALMMAALVVLGVFVTVSIGIRGLAPLLIGLIAGPIFAWFARSEAASRPNNFRRDADDLWQRLSHYVQTGSDYSDA